MSSLTDHLATILPQNTRTSLRANLLPNLLNSLSHIATTLRTVTTVAPVGSSNSFGDDQLNVDVLAEEHIRKALSQCPSVVTASSEEDPVERAVEHESALGEKEGETYTVAFDPLDGSSIIAPNWTVGAIFGIWDGATSLNADPREKQIASILGTFGPRTNAIIALRMPDISPVCFEVGLGATGWELTRPSVTLSKTPFKTRYFAPANLRSASENPSYMSLISTFIEERYTLRYAGGLVPDMVHALTYGHGLYISPVTGTSKAKLRRLYELYPVALIMECAGGVAHDPVDGRAILDRVLESVDERAGLVCGNGEEVERALKVLNG